MIVNSICEMNFNGSFMCVTECTSVAGSDTKACPIARGKFDSKKHSFGQV